MHFLKLVIETNENYIDTSLFPWLPKSETNIQIKFDMIPIKYLDKQYFISVAFPYKYNYIHLEHNDDIFKVNLIHSSYELNLALYSCSKYNDFTYTINDLKYKIPADKFNDFFFSSETLIPINHIEYYYKNFNSDYLPPMAYLKCQSKDVHIGSILFNTTNKSIYGILMGKYDNHIVIPSVAIKRLLDGVNTEFKYSNFYSDYKIYTRNGISSGIKILTSNYEMIQPSDIIVDFNDTMIIKGRIKYNKINEWVPIEVYLWYEWLPQNDITVTFHHSGKPNSIKSLPFINFKDNLSIPYKSTYKNSKVMGLSYELLDYFYKKNIMFLNDEITESISNPYSKTKVEIDVDEELLAKKYMEPTEVLANVHV